MRIVNGGVCKKLPRDSEGSEIVKSGTISIECGCQLALSDFIVSSFSFI